MIWSASKESPIQLYYCKANIKCGKTVIIEQDGLKVATAGVSFKKLHGSFCHQNSKGKAKQSGARNVLCITSGEVKTID